MDYEYISWNKLQEICFNFAKQIKRDNFKPDLIIAIARGGLVVGRIMADLLEISDIKSILVKSYENQKQKSHIRIEGFRNELFINKKILICEDIVDSGDSLNEILKKMKENLLMGGEIRTLAIIKRQVSSFSPNYFSLLENDNWIIYPWELNETYKELINHYSKENSYTIMLNAGVPENILNKIVNFNDN